ncbi:MAG: RagB/SusD family nutrient uptake outer membrane protein [Prevotellaceae bacterium]|nr:RagB/SusD family nutrient uptake outer membrane protein [Prevotellaceae bacterium]
MKKIGILLLAFTGLFWASSCNDEFMDRVPENSISDGAVWKTPNDLQLYVNNFYNREDLLLYDNSAGGSCNIGIYTIDRDNGSDTEIPRDYNTHMNGQTTLPATGGGWARGDWAALRDINHFFANYQKATGDEAEINRYVGEALFFRAIFYYAKLRRFGDVPWYDQLLNPDDVEELNKPRDSRKVVVENLMADLDKAVAYLPSRGAGAAWDGRVNKEAAMVLQARIALYEGTWEKYHAGTNFGVSGSDGSAFIKKAADVTDALIALGTCALDNVGAENGYQNVFNKESYGGSKEVLFWRQYNASLGITNGWSDFSTYGALTGLSKSMVESYLCTDGKPIEGNSLYQGDATLLDVVANRDPRLNQTIYVNDGQHQQLHSSQPNSIFVYPSFAENDKLCVTGYQLYKGHIPSLNLDGSRNQNAMIYFRYAEALLINAEAKAELGTITQADLDNTINKLRNRVGMPSMTLADVNSWSGNYTKEFPALSNIINEIRRERKVELAAEGFRVDDIFRWAAAGILIKGYQPKGAKLAQWQGTLTPDPTQAFKDAVAGLTEDADGYIFPYANQQAVAATGYNFDVNRDYLRPLPTDQLVLNPKLAPNNPGW